MDDTSRLLAERDRLRRALEAIAAQARADGALCAAELETRLEDLRRLAEAALERH